MLAKYIKEFKDYSNEELVRMYRESGNESIIRHLIYTNKDLILCINKKFFLKKTDDEDMLQEIYIGFYEAIEKYDFEKTYFRPFAYQVMKRRCIDSVNKSNRQKNIANLDSMSLQLSVSEDRDTTIQDMLCSSKRTSPDYVIDYKDNYKICDKIIKKLLSNYEYSIWTSLIWGITYDELSALLKKNKKSIDNAFQKSKNKIKMNMQKYHITYDMLKKYINYIKFHIEDFSFGDINFSNAVFSN